MKARSRKLWRRFLLSLAALIILLLLVELIFRNRVLQHSIASRAYAQGRKSLAEKIWTKALDQNDGDPIPEGSLGKLNYKSGAYYKAQQQLNAAVREKDQNPVPHYDLGNTLYRSEKLDEALKQYKSAMLLDPADQDAKSNYELVLKRKGYKPPPPPKDQSGDQQQKNKPPKNQPQASPEQKEQFNNTLEALDQKEASDRNANRQARAPEKEGKWW